MELCDQAGVKMFKALNIVSYCASLPVLIVWTILLVKIHLLGE